MKNVLLFWALLIVALSGCSSASPIESNKVLVTGQGSTFEEAKNSAFLLAIESQVGVVLTQDLEVTNYEVMRSDLAKYSAGYVDSYNIINSSYRDGIHSVDMEVVVSSTKLRNFMLHRTNNAGHFDGDAHYTQVQTHNMQQQNRINLISNLFAFYPTEAFDVSANKYHLDASVTGKLELVIPYELHWNNNFISALKETLEVTANHVASQVRPVYRSSSSLPVKIVVNSTDRTKWIGREQTRHYYFNDTEIVDNVVNQMSYQNSIRLLLKIISVNNTVLVNTCVTPKMMLPKFMSRANRDDLYGFWNNKIYIYGDDMERHQIRVLVDSSETLKKIDKIDITVISHKYCP